MIAFARKQRFRFQVGNVNVRGPQLPVQLFQQVFPLLGIGFFLRKMDISLKVAAHRSEFLVCTNLLFGALALAQHALCGFLIVPEIGFGAAGFEPFQPFTVARRVKDNSARARPAASMLRSDVANLRGSFLCLVVGVANPALVIPNPRSGARDLLFSEIQNSGYFPGFQEITNRIAETITQSHANQSPNRV